MEISARQKDILDKIITEYISSANPISSQLLEKKYKFKVCPATIRNEMQALTKVGYLIQPHTSAGRIPTDKAYRLFVDELLNAGLFGQIDFTMDNWFEKEIKAPIKLIQALTKNLADFSSNLALTCLLEDKIFWKEGWETIAQKPESKQSKFISDFSQLLKNFEQEIEELHLNSKIKIYIGKENPFSRTKDFSIMVSQCQFPEKKQGILAILGPKRMDYNKNIGLINLGKTLLEELSL